MDWGVTPRPLERSKTFGDIQNKNIQTFAISRNIYDVALSIQTKQRTTMYTYEYIVERKGVW